MYNKNKTIGWGRVAEDGAEIWDDNPVFKKDKVELKDWLKLLFYPKKFLLYRYIKSHKSKVISQKSLTEPFRILDVGCGTGAAVIDLKRLFGRGVEVIGIDVVQLQIDLAQEKIKKSAVWAEVEWYDGESIPFPKDYFDAVYTSDVLGHVKNVPEWLFNLNRVLKPGGVLAMFSESELGKHAYIRKYMFKRGLNVDPHAEFHISLYSKAKLRNMISEAGFDIKRMYSSFWLSFFAHPDEFYEKLQGQKKFFILRMINKILYKLKKLTHPSRFIGTALVEIYGLVEMLTIGRFIESQGYVILARKK